jgi:nucleotide-binding universal stress UspA family protein
MMKTIALHIHEDSGMESRLQVALDLARAHDAHLTCVQATTQFVPVSYSTLGAEYYTNVDMSDLHEADDELREKIESHLRQEDVPWDWLAGIGDAASQLIENSILADLVVLSQSRDQGDRFGRPLPIAGDVAVNAHCPVMVVPISQTAFDSNRPVVVGWNGSGEAARAIRSTLPILRKAADVHIATVDETRRDFPHVEASVYLARHGIQSELHQLDPKGESPSQVIQKFAGEQGVGAIVMGAYGHSRIRETLFGGVTRELLNQCDIPMIMAH